MRMSDLISKFQLECPDLVEAMEKNTHHYSREKLNPHHREGNTYSHFIAVCLMTEVLKVNKLVKIACLLHDIGKPMSTRVDHETQKVKMYNHEAYSVFLGMKFLNSLELTTEEKVRVIQLINYHTFIYKAMRDPETFEATVMDKFKGQPELLMDLLDMTACDALGRFMEGDEKRDFWMNVHTHLGHLVYKCDVPVIHRETQGEAIVLVGVPCSGKSTWIKNNAKDYTVISRDEIIMELGKGKTYNEAFSSVDQDKVNQQYDLRKRDLLKTEKKIVFDLTNMSVKARRKALSGIPKDMKRTAVVLLSSLDEIYKRNEQRNKEEGKFISHRTFEQMMGAFNYPTLTEGFDEIKVIIT